MDGSRSSKRGCPISTQKIYTRWQDKHAHISFVREELSRGNSYFSIAIKVASGEGLACVVTGALQRAVYANYSRLCIKKQIAFMFKCVRYFTNLYFVSIQSPTVLTIQLVVV